MRRRPRKGARMRWHFHRWSVWQDMVQDVVMRTGAGRHVTGTRAGQWRICAACNKREERTV